MKYGIDIGHNAAYDTGAAGIRQEDDLTREVGLKVISKLAALGHAVINCTPSTAASLGDSLYRRTAAANSNNVDIFMSIHFNSGGGRGTEAYAMSETARTLAQNIVNEIAALGYVNRGVKDGSWLYVVRNTTAPALLVECAFVDSQEDMNRYNGESMANAIVKGLTGSVPSGDGGSSGEEDNSNPPPPSQEQDTLNLQKILNRLKIRDYEGKALVEDGIPGARTLSAVKSFQEIAGFTVDGIAGPQTWGGLNVILGKPVLGAGFGDTTAVRYLQWRVGTKADGIFGPGTKAAVINYQLSNGLVGDGIVGRYTWGKLIG